MFGRRKPGSMLAPAFGLHSAQVCPGDYGGAPAAEAAQIAAC